MARRARIRDRSVPAVIAAVGVVVPARNEAALLGRCLDSIDAAARLVARDGLEVVCAVVLDACADASRAVAERALATHDAPHRDRLWERRSRSSGRHCGASEHFCVIIRPPRIWVATTDADTVVPKSWLSEQVRYADQGADAVAGIVEVADWSENRTGVRNDSPPHTPSIRMDRTVTSTAPTSAFALRPMR